MTLMLVSPRIGNAVDFGNNAVMVELEGGAGRYRLDKIGTTHRAPVMWVLEAQAYNYLMAFYRTEIDFGSLPFTINIKSVDAAASTTYTARIIPGTFKLAAYHGGVYEVAATLELTPQAHNESADQSLITAGP